MIDEVILGDCLQIMPWLDDKSIDMILCDLPYGVTRNAWDSIIPMEPLWSEYRRIIKDNGAIVLTSQQPFTTALINAAPDIFKYSMVWKKTCPTGFLNAKIQPLRIHEDVLVFYKQQPAYNPQKVKGDRYTATNSARNQKNYGAMNGTHETKSDGMRYPTTIIEFSNSNAEKEHPTEKPIKLFEYLIRTFTGGGDVVLDNCVGSGTTAVAAIRTGRHFIGMELNDEYYQVASQRVAEAMRKERPKTVLTDYLSI